MVMSTVADAAGPTLYPLSHLGFCLSTSFFTTGFPCGSAGKESTCNVGDLFCLIPGLGTSPGELNGYPHQYIGVDNFMDCTVHGVAKSRTRLSSFHFLYIFLYILVGSFLTI